MRASNKRRAVRERTAGIRSITPELTQTFKIPSQELFDCYLPTCPVVCHLTPLDRDSPNFVAPHAGTQLGFPVPIPSIRDVFLLVLQQPKPDQPHGLLPIPVLGTLTLTAH